MPFSIYKSESTGEVVEAVQAGHAGSLLEEKEGFLEGDWIIKGPLDLKGKRKLTVMRQEEFSKKFISLGKTKTDWKNFGWDF